MEAMDLAWAASVDLIYVSWSNPLLLMSSVIIIGVSLLALYCRLNLGICDCDQDMTGKTIFITGASSGIGKATAMDLARRNARVIMGCQDLDNDRFVVEEIIKTTGNKNVVAKALELRSWESIRKCAEEISRTEKKLDVLINNAGILVFNRQKYSEFNEMTMQVNYYGPFLLTLMLIAFCLWNASSKLSFDLLKKSAPSRIINVTSMMYKKANFDLNDIEGVKRNALLEFHAYAGSKLALILFTRELSRRLKNTGVTVNALHPGIVKTNIVKSSFGKFAWKVLEILFLFFLKASSDNKVEEMKSILRKKLQSSEEQTFKKFEDIVESVCQDVIETSQEEKVTETKQQNEETLLEASSTEISSQNKPMSLTHISPNDRRKHILKSHQAKFSMSKKSGAPHQFKSSQVRKLNPSEDSTWYSKKNFKG